MTSSRSGRASANLRVHIGPGYRLYFARLVGVWLTKAAIQTPEGDFSPEAAGRSFPDGLGQISRPTDRRGLRPATVVDAAAGAEDGAKGRTARE